MSQRCKRFLKETETYSISKTGKKKLNSNNDDNDPIPTHELIDRINIDLKHLHGQEKILQNAKLGKILRYKITSNYKSKTNNKNACLNKSNSQCNICCRHFCNILLQRKIVKVTDSSTQIGTSSFQNADRGSSKCKNHKSSKKHLESRKLSAGLGCKTYNGHNCLTKMETKSKRPETSYESHTYQNKDNNISRKAVKSKSMFVTQHPRNDRQTDQNFISSPRLTKTDEENVGRTESSIRRHAKLSREILEHAKKTAIQKINEIKSRKKKQSGKGLYFKINDRSLQQSQNEIPEAYQELNFAKEMSKNVKQDGKLSLMYDKREQRKDRHKISKFENNSLTEISCFSKSHEVNTIKQKVIDDSTYTCPDNSEENDYSLFPYVANTREDNDIFNLSPKAESQFEDTFRSVAILKDISSKKTSNLFGAFERKLKTCHANTDKQFKKMFSRNPVNQSRDREEYFSRKSDKFDHMNMNNLESTWESHHNRDGLLGSKFDMPSEINTPIFYRSHSSNLKDQPVQCFSKGSLQNKNKMTNLSPDFISNSITKDISKPLLPVQYDPKDYNPTKLVLQMKKENSTEMCDKNNKATTWNRSQNQYTNRSFSSQSNSTQDQIYNQTFLVEPKKPDLKNDLSISNMKEAIVYQTHNPVSTLQNKNFSNSITSWTPSDSEMQEQVLKPKLSAKIPIYDSNLDTIPKISANEKDLVPSLSNMKEATVYQTQNPVSTLQNKNLSNSITSWTPSDSEIQEQVLKRKLPPKIPIYDSDAIPKISANEKDLVTSISAQTETYAPENPPLKTKTNGSTEFDLSLEKNVSQNNQSDTKKSETNCIVYDLELGAISSSNEIVLKSINSFNSFMFSKENEFHDISRKSPEKIKGLTKDNSPTLQPERNLDEITSKSNQTISLKSKSNCNAGEGVSQTSFPSTISGLDSFAEINKLTNGKDFKLKSKLLNSLSISSVSSNCTKFENQDISQKSYRSETKIFNTSGGMSLQFQAEQPSEIETSKSNQSDWKKKLGANDIAEVESSIQLDGSDLSVIPSKLSANKNKRSLSDLPKKENTSNNSYSFPHNDPELNISTGMSSTLEELSKQKSSKGNHSAIRISQSPKTVSQNSLPKTNKSSSSQYLELFWNDNDKAKNSFCTSPLKFKQKSNLSRSSKSFHNLHDHRPAKILQGISSSDVSNADKLDGSNYSNRSMSSTQKLKTEPTNTKPTRTVSSMPLTFAQPKEERPSVSLNIQISNNQMKKEFNESFDENSSLSLDSVKNRKHVFLSETLTQNVTVEGVPREISDLIQHLQNRVMDCDENVKNKLRKLEKLKENCKKGEDEEKNPVNLIQKENTSNDAPLKKEDELENDVKKDIGCHCVFFENEQSTSDSSEEIPSFTGCDCMKENYYEIMRIAYDK